MKSLTVSPKPPLVGVNYVEHVEFLDDGWVAVQRPHRNWTGRSDTRRILKSYKLPVRVFGHVAGRSFNLFEDGMTDAMARLELIAINS